MVGDKKAYKAGGFTMKNVITLDDSMRTEIKENDINSSMLYETDEGPSLPNFFLMGKFAREKVK